jgi:uncharacterized SAM-binding protein YcdF (DUF218 family)
MYQLIVASLDPFLLLFLATAAGMANLWWKRQESRRRLWLITGPFVALAMICTPAAAYLAYGSLEWAYPPQLRRPAEVEAIVVLSGYLRSAEPEYARPQPELWYDSRDRCRLAAALYRDGPPCLVLATGGPKASDPAGPAIAEVMKEYLVKQGVASEDVITEVTSRSTYENAANSAPLLKERGIERIAVVTDAIHLWRAERSFRAQGFDVVPCGADYRAVELELSPFTFLPKASGAEDMRRVLHEWLGVVWYWARGRI